jgi:hypothetical protein
MCIGILPSTHASASSTPASSTIAYPTPVHAPIPPPPLSPIVFSWWIDTVPVSAIFINSADQDFKFNFIICPRKPVTVSLKTPDGAALDLENRTFCQWRSWHAVYAFNALDSNKQNTK